jgi:hypothetical protein
LKTFWPKFQLILDENKVGMTQTAGSQASALDAPQVGERQSFSPLVVIAVDHRRVFADAEVAATSFW